MNNIQEICYINNSETMSAISSKLLSGNIENERS